MKIKAHTERTSVEWHLVYPQFVAFAGEAVVETGSQYTNHNQQSTEHFGGALKWNSERMADWVGEWRDNEIPEVAKILKCTCRRRGKLVVWYVVPRTPINLHWYFDTTISTDAITRRAAKFGVKQVLGR